MLIPKIFVIQHFYRAYQSFDQRLQCSETVGAWCSLLPLWSSDTFKAAVKRTKETKDDVGSAINFAASHFLEPAHGSGWSRSK